jgi:hypothetical protein
MPSTPESPGLLACTLWPDPSLMAAKKTAALAKKKAAPKRGKPARKAARPPTKKAPRSSSPKRARATSSRTPGDLTTQLLSDLPRLTDADRAAFRAQFSDSQCDELGARTQAPAVHEEALAWAETMHGALKRHPHALRRYGATRFAWFVECIRALETSLVDQELERSSSAPMDMGLDLARIAAFSVRNDLKDTLSMLAGSDPSEKESVVRALGSNEGDEALVAALRGLADLAEWWLRRDDARAKTLVASVSLGESDVEAARSAARELAQAAGLAPLPDDATNRDAASVNRIEGRVLLEMSVALAVFGRAHGQTPAVPRLVPGSATRAVLIEKADEKKRNRRRK